VSYTTAIDAIKALLVADPISTDHPSITLHYAPDPRVDTLADLDGYVDGAFLLVATSSGNPYPYNQGISPSEWWAGIRLEVCTLLHTDVMAEDKVAEARGRAIQEVLCFNTYGAFVLYNVSDPTRTRAGEDRRIIWTINFSMRYSE